MIVASASAASIPAKALRAPETVMRLARVGSFHPTRISFTRTLIRRMARENWRFERTLFDLDARGIGTAVYKVDTSTAPIWFVVFADHLEPEDRTDRVIAEKWDATFTLTTREPDTDELSRLKANIPLQEAGRCTSGEMVLSRANKSVRLFEHVVEALARGMQPDRGKILDVGYLVRTTAVYGNGKFGLADLDQLRAAGVFGLPFQAEMLCVFMARQFSLDWVEHIASMRAPETFAPMDDGLKRALGVGNATGLGMAPFLIGHPKLIHAWIEARETALARVRAVTDREPEVEDRFHALLDRAVEHVRQWPTTDVLQQDRCVELLDDLARLTEFASGEGRASTWDELVDWAERNLGLEVQELLNSVLIELYPALVDELENQMGSDEVMRLVPGMTLRDLKSLIERAYHWALDVDFSVDAANARFWYRSEEKEEPRLGWRAREPGADKEMRIAIARDVSRLHVILAGQADEMLEATVGEFLMAYPEWRQTARRVQSLAGLGYAEFRDNLIDETCRPIDLLRCKLSMFGATKFDPKSDLWTRIAMFQGAPIAEGLSADDVDDWAFPFLATEAEG
jgi:hypothetical protein